MNALVKAKLIKELHELEQALDHDSLSLYETACAKKRIHDIFNLCDEPIFKSQIFAFKSRTQPELAAYQFVATTSYQLSFRGYFHKDTELIRSLKAFSVAGWAFLHHPQQGWQLWFMPSAEMEPQHSPWNDLESCYHWLLQHPRFDLKPDQQRIPSGLLIPFAEQPATQEISSYHLSDSPSPVHALTRGIQTIPLLSQVVQESSETQASPLSMQQTSLPHPNTAVSYEEVNFPLNLQLANMQAQVRPLEISDLARLCKLELDPIVAPWHVDLALYYAAEDQWQNQPVYLIEQLDEHGQWLKYLMLLGTSSLQQAQQCIEHWESLYKRHCIAIKSIQWTDIAQIFTQFDLLYNLYHDQAETCWTHASYLPFIPASSIHTSKFIQFEETPADFSTPLLLLQEHQKIRVIHGEQRLSLNPQEKTYPYLLLKRSKHLNWQKIHQIILSLPQPLSVHTLYTEILTQITE